MLGDVEAVCRAEKEPIGHRQAVAWVWTAVEVRVKDMRRGVKEMIME